MHYDSFTGHVDFQISIWWKALYHILWISWPCWIDSEINIYSKTVL